MARRETILRHRLPVRIWHWTNLAVLIVMLGSGLQILNAHPSLYWNSLSSNADAAFIAFEAKDVDGQLRGYTRVGTLSADTTGLLGVSRFEGEPAVRAFPAWSTLPGYQDLATGRLWHFFFAWIFVLNGAAFVAWGLLGRHIGRDLLPNRDQVRARHIWHEVRDHARLRFAKGDEAKRYNVLQKATYLSVLFGLLPMMVGTGLTMSPGVDAAWPWILDLFGGRQAARTLHFLAAFGLFSFVLLHVALVLVSGLRNNIRSMITGRYTIVHGDRP
jgi:thiosulfate reductase cytochrome b subunit